MLSTVYVNQTILSGRLRKNWGAKQKSGGHGPPRPPLESPLHPNPTNTTDWVPSSGWSCERSCTVYI